MNYTLRKYQEDALQTIWGALPTDKYILMQLATGAGKCLGEGTPVMLFDGSVKPVEKIVPGDLLMGPDSKPRRVLTTNTGTEEMFEVVPIKGDTYVVNKSHILSLKIANNTRTISGYKPGSIVNISVEDYLNQTKNFRWLAKGWRTKINFPKKDICHDLPPYILGVWLGDGSNHHPNIVTNPDHEILKSLIEYGESIDTSVSVTFHKDKCQTYSVSNGVKGPGKNRMITAINSYGLCFNKHIPNDYKINSEEIRLEVLAGILDTDGHLIRSGYEYVSKDKQLAEDVAFIARSVGLAAYIKESYKKAQGWSEPRLYYRVTISGDCSIIPCRIAYKKSPKRKQVKSVLVTGITVNPIGIGKYYGFTLDSDGLFLLGDFTVTHNTVIFCELIKRLLMQWPKIRIGILAHRRELITQAQDKLLKVWPSAPIGIACASISNDIVTDKPVVIGSVQTLSRRTGTTDPFDIVIIDEVHRLPPMNVKSQYSSWIQTMEVYNQNMRIIGFTATPFRLSSGYCFGTMCKPGDKNLFTDLHYRIGIKDLQKQGFLCGYRAKILADISNDLKVVRRTGDYNIGDLSAVMSKQQHVGSAVNALNEYAADRKHVIVFAVTIAHAEKLKDAFGDQATVIHSGLSDADRYKALDDFESGKTRIIVNVGILTEGFDSPAVDCVIMCRPTVSSALFVQMCGRGLRLHPDKKDVLILDLANNCITHGDPDSPKVVIPKPDKKKEDQILEKRQKVCPNCKEAIEPRCTFCPVCGYEFVIENNGDVALTDYNFKTNPILTAEIGDAVFHKHCSKAGNIMTRLSLDCYIGNEIIPIKVNHYFQFDDDAHPYARGNSRKIWRNVTGGSNPPESTDEALAREREFFSGLAAIDTIGIQEDGKFVKVVRWG